MPVAHPWRPITDLGDDARSLTEGELRSLQRVWADYKKDLIEPAVLDEFDKRLRREWSIETGIIENVYTLDRGVTRTLIAKGIQAALIPHGASNRDPEWVARIIQDHYDTLEEMFDFVGGQRELTTGYIKALHAALLRNQATYTVVDQFGEVHEQLLEKGWYKAEPNSPTRPDGREHQYCPPEHVASEMDELIRMHLGQAARAVPVEVRAAWLHHRFTQIHPFADGNGRVARAIASLVFIKAGWFPLIVKRDDREQYIDALEKADAGELPPLVSMFVEAQRAAVIQASEMAFELRPVASADEAIAAARDRLVQRGKLPHKEWLIAKETAGKLQQVALQRLQKLAGELHSEIGAARHEFKFGAHVGDVSQSGIPIAVPPPDFAEYRSAVQMTLDTGSVATLTVSFYALGPRFRGIIEVIAYLLVQSGNPVLLADGAFQINYAEAPETADERFSPWLERAIVEGLNAWRRTL